MPGTLNDFAVQQAVAAAAGGAVWLLGRTPWLGRRPAASHTLWLLVLLLLAAPPGIWRADWFAGDNTAAPPDAAQYGEAQYAAAARCGCYPVGTAYSAPPPVGSAAPSNGPFGSMGEGTLLVLLGASLLMTCVLWFGIARRFVRVRRLLRSDQEAPARAARLLQEASRRFRLQTEVGLRLVDASLPPMLWAEPGRPVIVLPRPLIDTIDDEALRGILAHELGHYVRRDHWVALATTAVATLFWWNPAVWFARRQASAAAEACCDALALERTGVSRKSYARALLSVVDWMSGNPPLPSSFGVSFGRPCERDGARLLRSRIAMIADRGVQPRMTRRLGRLLTCGCVTLVLASAFAGGLGQSAASGSHLEAAAAKSPAADPYGAAIPLYCCPS
ncbi:Regulatory protein BlaR1 [Pirellulimonas nuda]|uniref:Regulatory protein BlaR1 n=1 Tax=Pirellulimonas nuda TaxID=2528009 RepID=A0A518DE33_9BACT|nr:M56 family metallopeptidase [Pirellulimonas nuda]QDU89731.1 Regulatory protein BlaR1 [Pirellulimonas nuda]